MSNMVQTVFLLLIPTSCSFRIDIIILSLPTPDTRQTLTPTAAACSILHFADTLGLLRFNVSFPPFEFHWKAKL